MHASLISLKNPFGKFLFSEFISIDYNQKIAVEQYTEKINALTTGQLLSGLDPTPKTINPDEITALCTIFDILAHLVEHSSEVASILLSNELNLDSLLINMLACKVDLRIKNSILRLITKFSIHNDFVQRICTEFCNLNMIDSKNPNKSILIVIYIISDFYKPKLKILIVLHFVCALNLYVVLQVIIWWAYI